MTTNQKTVAMKTLEACEPENSSTWWSEVEDQIHKAASEGEWSCKVKSIPYHRDFVLNYLKMLGFSVSFYEDIREEKECVEISWRF